MGNIAVFLLSKLTFRKNMSPHLQSGKNQPARSYISGNKQTELLRFSLLDTAIVLPS
jgi:hypothetical protein